MMELTNHNEQQLMDLLRDNDHVAFTEIYNRYWKKLLAIAYRHTCDKSTAEELVQEVMISLWNRRGEVQIKSLTTYLATAIKFAVFKHINRARNREKLAGNHYKMTRMTLDEDEIHARFLKEYIDGEVEQLPEKCRLVFRYSREAYKTNAEIADELAISEKAVEAHITRAIKILKFNLRKAGILGLILFSFRDYFH